MQVGLGDLLAIGGVLVTVGVYLATLAAIKERVKRVEKSFDGLGARVGVLETISGILADRQGGRRPSRVGIPTVIHDDEESGKSG